MKIAVTHPGKIGDCLYSLPICRQLKEVDFWTSSYCSPLKNLFEHQSCIKSFNIKQDYQISHDGCGIQPYSLGELPEYYDKIVELGFRDYPQKNLIKYMANLAGIPEENLEIKYDVVEYDLELPNKFIVLAPGRDEYFKLCMYKLMQFLSSDIGIVQVGLPEEIIPNFGTAHCVDLSKTLYIISKSIAYIGSLSSNLVLANGFDIPKVCFALPWRQNSIHDIYTDKHLYLTTPDHKKAHDFLRNYI